MDADANSAKIGMGTDREKAEDIVAKMIADDGLTAEQKKLLNTTILNGRWFSAVLDSSTIHYED